MSKLTRRNFLGAAAVMARQANRTENAALFIGEASV